jgi:ABC-type transporter Mla subunit MlaD
MTTLANLNRLTADLDETQRGIGAAFASAGTKFNALAGDLDATAVALHRDLVPAVAGVIAKADQTAAGAESLVANDLKQLVTALRQELIPQVQQVLRNADGAARGAGDATASLKQELPPILEKLKTSLDTIQGIALDLKQASVQAPALIQEGGSLVQDSSALVKRVGGMWLLRSSDPPPTERTIDVDSYQRRK